MGRNGWIVAAAPMRRVLGRVVFPDYSPFPKFSRVERLSPPGRRFCSRPNLPTVWVGRMTRILRHVAELLQFPPQTVSDDSDETDRADRNESQRDHADACPVRNHGS